MIPFHSLHVAPKQDYLDSIHFHSFPFLYFKTSNQGYLIPFHSILFHSFPLNTFHSFSFPYDHSIPFHFFINSQAEPNDLFGSLERKENRGEESSEKILGLVVKLSTIISQSTLMVIVQDLTDPTLILTGALTVTFPWL